MIFKIIGALLIVAITAIILNVIGHEKKKNKSKISFKEAIDLVELPVITLYNNKNKLNFLLDTGSNLSYINESLLSNLEYKETEGKSDVIGIEGKKITTRSCHMSIVYKKEIFEEEFNIIDLSNAFNTLKQESGVQIHGILGSRFFEKYQYIIDFNELIAYRK